MESFLFDMPFSKSVLGDFMDLNEENNDEDVSIDFSKVKNLFKRKKKVSEEPKKEEIKSIKEKEEEPKQEIKEEDEETNIDFGKIKNIFKRKEVKKEIEKPKESDEREEEDINIDFSKIKSIFKKKEKPETNEETKPGEEAEEEISIDFKKVKNFFKGLKEKKSEKGEDEGEIYLDVKKTFDFFKKYQKFLLPAILIIIAMSFSIYLRIQPVYLPITDNWATNAVYNQIRSSIRGQIDQQYPNLPGPNKDSLVETEFQKILKSQKNQIYQQIKATSNYFKSKLQDDKGHTYIPDIDPYFFMRHARNILKNGHPGDELRNGRPYDNHMYAPLGRYVPQDIMHAYSMAYFYKLLHLFNKDIELTRAVFFLPIVLSLLYIIPAFFIGKRLSNNFGGFIAAFIVAIHPSVLVRTSGGFADTDINNVLFPLLITWLFLEAFESKNTKGMVLYSILSGFFVGLFSFAWGGWWYIFDFILVTIIIYVLLQLSIHRKKIKDFVKKSAIKNTLLLIIIFLISSALFTSIFTDFVTFKGAFFSGSLAFINLKQVAITTIWPNVFTTVAEQNPASLDSVISQISIGSIFLLLIALAGIVLTTFRKDTRRIFDLWFFIGSVIWFILIIAVKPENLILFLILISIPIMIKLFIVIKEKDIEVDIKTAILLILWFIATTYASTKGVRYLLLAVPAFGIALSVPLGLGYSYVSRLISGSLKIHKTLSNVVVIILFCLLLWGPFRSAQVIAKGQIPYVNDEWFASLEKVRIESKPNAIINSWWDFGHWFKFLGDRAVTFDGTSQNSPNAHWIGSVLLTDDEKYAVGILRMVDCGQNMAFEELDKVIKDEPKSIEIMEGIVRLDKEKAKSELLKKGLNEEEANNVLKYSHCTPPEDYFISSYDMVGKSGVWAHFGSWDFERGLIYNTLKKREYSDDLEKSISFLHDRYNYTREKAESIYYEVQSIKNDAEANSWIAPWPSYAGSAGCIKTEENKVSCGIGQGAQVEIDLETLQADIQTAQGIMHPNSVVLPLEDGTYKERSFNNTIGISITLMPTGEESYQALILSPQLAKSMFTIMFYLNGHGLKYFDKFSDLNDITGGRIIVWKVNWEGNSTNLLEYYQPKPIPEEEVVKEIMNESKESVGKENISPSINNSQDINTSNRSSD